MTQEHAPVPPALAGDQLLAEQLRLVAGNVASGVLPVVLATSLVVVVLVTQVPAWPVVAWWAALIASKLLLAWDGRRRRARGIEVKDARRVRNFMVAAHGVDGVIWGVLPWISLHQTTLSGSTLVIAAIAGVLGGSVSSLAPVLAVFLAFDFVVLAMSVGKLLAMGTADYWAVAAGALLYGVNLAAQARHSARATRSSIELRFQNLALIDRLRTETQHAEEANRVKSKFLAAASHDLRQPVHAQGLFLEVLANTALSAHQRDVLESARSAARASGEMLDTLLDFSRIEAGVVRPNRRAFALQPLLHQIENDLAPLADAKGLAFRMAETAAVTESDPALVEMVLRNLVSNAIRYTERGGVLVSVRPRAGELEVGVWDTGIGIAPEHQQEVFREFHQLGNPERDRRKGLGLGLAIAQGLAHALGHRLTLSSRVGRGSVFRLLLPRLPFTSAELVPDTPPRELPRPVEGVHVLVIDDDEAVRQGMALVLASWGFECDTAGTIDEAMQHAVRCRPDVIVSDYRLRELGTGALAIAAVRDVCDADIPALLITGDTAPERLREAEGTGVPVLHKPLSARDLHEALLAALRQGAPTVSFTESSP